jgi:hypothetical protein
VLFETEHNPQPFWRLFPVQSELHFAGHSRAGLTAAGVGQVNQNLDGRVIKAGYLLVLVEIELKNTSPVTVHQVHTAAAGLNVYIRNLQ